MAGFEDIFSSAAYSKTMYYLVVSVEILLGAIVFFGGLFLIIYLFQFRNKAVIRDAQRNYHGSIKRFRIVRRKGDTYIKFFGKDKMPLPPSQAFAPYGKKGSMISLIKDGEIYMPLVPSPNPGHLQAIGDFRSVMKWYMYDKHETDEAYKKKQSTLMTILPWAGFIVMCTVFFIMVIFLLKRFDMVIKAGASVAEQSAHIGQQLIGAP